MNRLAILFTSLALLSPSLLVVGCSGGDGSDDPSAESSDELTGIGDEAAWEEDDDRAAPATEERGHVDALSIHGNDIQSGGHRFVSRGVIFEGYLYTKKDIQDCVDGDYGGDNEGQKFCKRHLLARDYYEGKGTFAGHDALSLAITDWNANTVRFNLNQSALDPGSKAYQPAYLDEIAQVTHEARQRGLVVVLAPFSGRNLGAPDKLVTDFPKYPMPTEATMGAIDALSRRFGDDAGIVFDLFNEPFGSWSTYLDGGTGSGEWAGVHFVGVNDLLARMRARGAKNLAVVQGLSADWSDYPGGIRDTKVVLSGHPFLPNKTELLNGEGIDWYSKFGEIARTRPFWITAWNASAGDKWCNHFGVGLATEFVQYVDKKKMGLVGFAFDSPYSMTKDFRDKLDAATQIGTVCSDAANAQAGDVLQAEFRGTLPALKNGKPQGGKISVTKHPKAGQPIVISVDAKDPDHDPLSYAVKVAGEDASDRQHGGTLHVVIPHAGAKKVTVVIADNKGAIVRKTVTLHVTN